jgi:hypothetical protein
MEGSCSTGQSPQWAVVPLEEEEEEEGTTWPWPIIMHSKYFTGETEKSQKP